jgi:NAD(P)H-hydrate epimerase
MVEVDRLMIDDFGISLVRMMENAGRGVANLARHLLGGEVSDARVLVLSGTGGNGGGGLVAARHLANAGAEVDVRLASEPDRLTPVPAEQHAILTRMGVRVAQGLPLPDGPDLVVDALLGYSLDGAPRGSYAELIRALPAVPRASLDVPSGLELRTGIVHDPHVEATATLTLAAPKRGLEVNVVGDLYLADISVPAAVYDALGVEYRSPFAAGPLVALI